MSRTCPQCGAENRDSAKFCLKCAHQLVALGAVTEPAALESPKRRRKRRPKTPAQAPRTRQMALWSVVLIVALISMGIFIGRWDARPDAPSPQSTRPSAPALAAPSTPDALPNAAPESAALAQVAAALESLQAPATIAPTASAASAAEPAHAAKPPARRRTAKASAEPPPPPAAEPVVTPEPPPPAPAPVAAPRPAPPRELCAGTSFVARGYCMQTECDKPGMGSHPQCVRMREQQDAMRRGSGEG